MLTDKLPALKNVTSRQVIADHLNAMIEARKAFVELKASDKLKRALAWKVKTAISLIYDTGYKVFYKSNQLIKVLILLL